MKYVQGDPIFSRHGSPGIVRHVNKSKENLEVDSSVPLVKQHFRHGYIQGLSSDGRLKFNNIMDKVGEVELPLEKVNTLKEYVEKLELDTDLKNRELIGYLKSEIAHIMFTKSISPRYYSLEESKVP